MDTQHSYRIFLHQDAESGMWLVDVPDLPGVITEGKTPEAAREHAREAIALHLDGLREDGEPIPAPNTYEMSIV